MGSRADGPLRALTPCPAAAVPSRPQAQLPAACHCSFAGGVGGVLPGLGLQRDLLASHLPQCSLPGTPQTSSAAWLCPRSPVGQPSPPDILLHASNPLLPACRLAGAEAGGAGRRHVGGPMERRQGRQGRSRRWQGLRQVSCCSCSLCCLICLFFLLVILAMCALHKGGRERAALKTNTGTTARGAINTLPAHPHISELPLPAPSAPPQPPYSAFSQPTPLCALITTKHPFFPCPPPQIPWHWRGRGWESEGRGHGGG